jgi:hypothetical protein
VIHHVTVQVSVDAPHNEVSGRVLAAVVREFQDREPGAVQVTGFDLRKLEATLAAITVERDAYRKGWLEEQGKVAALTAEVAALKKKMRTK